MFSDNISYINTVIQTKGHLMLKKLKSIIVPNGDLTINFAERI